jgi:MoxR-like ATPase
VPSFIKEYDHIQEDMIRRVLAGESLIIKGPPGTGKTLTIVNMIATLLEQGKKVMLASEKLAALSEVYNKLPDELRDFVMLLAC